MSYMRVIMNEVPSSMTWSETMKLFRKSVEPGLNGLKKQKIIGCNVTVPFKKKVIPFLDKLSIQAEQTQSVNTIIFEKGNLIGHNTDIVGFDKAIKALNFDMKNRKILILGAGGVVPSIIFALKEMDVLEITISNRTKQKAENLKILFKNLNVVEWGNLSEFDVVINATSLGLNNEKINLNFSNIGKNKLFYDVIYNPGQTNFLLKAKKFGNQIENGKMMFIYQAQLAFEIWHNILPTVDNEIIKLLD